MSKTVMERRLMKVTKKMVNAVDRGAKVAKAIADLASIHGMKKPKDWVIILQSDDVVVEFKGGKVSNLIVNLEMCKARLVADSLRD